MRPFCRQDWIIPALHRMAVRRGLGRADVEHLLQKRAGMSSLSANHLASHWFSEQYRHGGVAYLRAVYLQRRKAFGVEGLRPVEAPACFTRAAFAGMAVSNQEES